ncbi:hypothetical protein KCP69_09655 [Salmonella enterica subsp. enterica]|nr:hypothetical protein KCP69_09655 [Salmonella enterica subsp. enterica]
MTHNKVPAVQLLDNSVLYQPPGERRVRHRLYHKCAGSLARLCCIWRPRLSIFLYSSLCERHVEALVCFSRLYETIGHAFGLFADPAAVAGSGLGRRGKAFNALVDQAVTTQHAWLTPGAARR